MFWSYWKLFKHCPDTFTHCSDFHNLLAVVNLHECKGSASRGACIDWFSSRILQGVDNLKCLCYAHEKNKSDSWPRARIYRRRDPVCSKSKLFTCCTTQDNRQIPPPRQHRNKTGNAAPTFSGDCLRKRSNLNQYMGQHLTASPCDWKQTITCMNILMSTDNTDEKTIKRAVS